MSGGVLSCHRLNSSVELGDVSWPYTIMNVTYTFDMLYIQIYDQRTVKACGLT